jgi:Flp pilus assembly protein TadB
MATLLGGIVSDIQTLVRQEVSLAKSEFLREWEKTKTAAGSLAAGAVLLVASVPLLLMTVVCVLHEVAGLPWWASFLIVGAVFGLTGAVLLYTGKNRAAAVNVTMPQTVETMRENVQWMQNPK